ncbi:hypothetical protein LC612_37065 [Nostoc sp. CHAB 5834]|nr:hypothetical protein [Nostoc sp. CHAB 5834]
MNSYGITNVWLSRHARISDQALSNFRNSKSGLNSANLERIISALPVNAQEFFFQQLYPINKDLRSLILKASDDEKAEVLRLIAASLSSGVVADRSEPMPV